MTTYYDLPLLKPPVWTWEVPTYFFVGGAAGAAAVIGAAARMSGADAKLVRDARWIAAIGAGLSAPLLIADLGRPARFLNMLRVLKPQSPMSVGAWTVAAFGAGSTAAVIAPGTSLRDAAAAVSALTGLVMATYTGVLLGATAIPVWKRHVVRLPSHFAGSALGAAVSLLELRGNKHAALNALGLGASLFEAATGLAIEERTALLKVSEALSGTVPFLLRLFGKRKAAAAATLLGSLITRIAWVEAGKASAKDPKQALG
jgi:hypothetical protein